VGDTTTPTIGLVRPAVGASRSTWGTKWNANADQLDNWIGVYLQGLIAQLESDVATLQNQMAAIGATGAPIGAIFPWPDFGNYPPGYVLCSGGTLPVASYPALYGVIGNIYGGDAVNFGLPDFRGCVLTGYDGGTGRLGGLVADAPGAIGGAPYIALNESQMPSHQHGGTTDSQGHHDHGYTTFSLPAAFAFAFGNGATVQGVGARTDGAGDHFHFFTTDWHGGGAGHPNLQVSAVIAWIIRAI
jgi:microcystin-dependent protein